MLKIGDTVLVDDWGRVYDLIITETNIQSSYTNKEYIRGIVTKCYSHLRYKLNTPVTIDYEKVSPHRISSFAAVKVPSIIEEPYCNFHPNWIKFAKANDGKVVRLKGLHDMFHAPDGSYSEEIFRGWNVDTYQKIDGVTPGPDCASWLPKEWLIPAEKESLACDCSNQDLMIHGCQISWHH